MPKNIRINLGHLRQNRESNKLINLLIMHMNSNIKFIHYAIPNLNFNDISILQKITFYAGNSQKRVSINCPPLALQVPFNPEMDNKVKLQKLKKTTGLSLFLSSKNMKTLFILHKNNIIKRKLNSVGAFKAEDGLDAAKAIRLKQLPFLNDINKINLIEKQLKVVMFLTNSKNIAQLVHAPIIHLYDLNNGKRKK